LLAGFAANVVGSFVKGLMPLRAGRAGLFFTRNLAKPGSTNAPFFFSSLWPISANASTIAPTCFRVVSSPSASAMLWSRTLFVNFFEGDLAIGNAFRMESSGSTQPPLALEFQQNRAALQPILRKSP